MATVLPSPPSTRQQTSPTAGFVEEARNARPKTLAASAEPPEARRESNGGAAAALEIGGSGDRRRSAAAAPAAAAEGGKDVVGDNSRARDVYHLLKGGASAEFRGTYRNLVTLTAALSRLCDSEREAKQRRRRAAPAAEGERETLRRLYEQERAAKEQKAAILSRLHVQMVCRGEPLLSSRLSLGLDADSISGAGAAPDVPAHAVPEARRGAALRMAFAEYRARVAAAEMERRGVPVPQLGPEARLHPVWSVFPPTRADYLDLAAQLLRTWRSSGRPCRLALDAGSGSGVLSFLAARLAGFGSVLGTDAAPLAAASAQADARRLRLSAACRFLRESAALPEGLEPGSVDLILCNPPWMPGPAPSRIDSSVFAGGLEGGPDLLEAVLQARAPCRTPLPASSLA
eukprot:tig00020710_g13372.t1